MLLLPLLFLFLLGALPALAHDGARLRRHHARAAAVRLGNVESGHDGAAGQHAQGGQSSSDVHSGTGSQGGHRTPQDGAGAAQRRDHAFSGRGTYYRPDLGACGWRNDPDDHVVALGSRQFGHGARCGHRIRVCHQGNCISVQVVDRCESCDFGSLDMSPSAFARLAPKSEGVIDIAWDYTSSH